MFVRSVDKKPNLLIIYTDEFNYKMLGAYRDYLSREEAHPWGDGVKVNTPNINSIAKQGALYKNYHATSPICTLSRASFLTGCYPKTVGIVNNDDPMDDSATTFADILNKEGYDTGYIGKWHLNGKLDPGWYNPSRDNNFGFSDAKYLYNKGHWKFFEEVDGKTKGYMYKNREKFAGKYSKHYATDFLFDRGIDFLKKRKGKNKPFALMISIPDPHDPVDVRRPFDTMFDHFTFDIPPTTVKALKNSPALPKWANVNLKRAIGLKWNGAHPKIAERRVRILRKNKRRQEVLQKTFGMVKCIDKNVGKILKYLKSSGLDENTIVVFTADHGDMMGEHLRHNKLVPYDTSAGVPFIIRYPGKINPHKIINTAYTSVDFAPTILSIMGVSSKSLCSHGIDGSNELLNNNNKADNSKQIRFMTSTEKNQRWAAALTSRHKLILSKDDVPWFYDTFEDREELINFHVGNNTKYSDTIRTMKLELDFIMREYGFPLAEEGTYFWDQPSCIDSRDAIQMETELFGSCSPLRHESLKNIWCKKKRMSDHCPYACGVCDEDSSGIIKARGEFRTCEEVNANKKIVQA